MNVSVTLHGLLRDYLPKKAKGKTTLDLAEGATLNDILQALQINRTVNGTLNGVEVDLSHVLKDGDEVQLFRPIAGG